MKWFKLYSKNLSSQECMFSTLQSVKKKKKMHLPDDSQKAMPKITMKTLERGKCTLSDMKGETANTNKLSQCKQDESISSTDGRNMLLHLLKPFLFLNYLKNRKE